MPIIIAVPTAVFSWAFVERWGNVLVLVKTSIGPFQQLHVLTFVLYAP